MIGLDYIRTIWDYNYWAHRKLWDCIMSVSDEDFQKDVPYSIGSVHKQIVHVMWAEALWLSRILGQPRMDWTIETHLTRESIREEWDIVEVDWRNYLTNVNDIELHRQISAYSGSRQKYYTHYIWDILIHVVNHGTDHRGQILRIIHDFGGKTFEQDMAYYFRELRE